MPNLNYVQEIRIGDQQQPINVERQEVIIDSLWNTVKNFCVPIAAIAILVFTSFMAYSCGQKNQNQPKAAVVTVPGIDRLASTIEKVAETKPSSSATVTATSATTTETVIKTPPPTPAPAVVIRMPDRLKVEVVDSNPPPQTAPPVTQPPADPMADKTPKERCDYEIIVLRRSHCSQ